MTQNNQNAQSDVPNSSLGQDATDTVQDTDANQNQDIHNPLSGGEDYSDVTRNNADTRVKQGILDKFKYQWNENGIFRIGIIIVSAITLLILFGIFKLFFGGNDAPEQVGNIKMDTPETSAKQAEEVTPEQYQYIRQQEAILAQEAQARGESFTPRNLVIRQSDAQGQAVLPSTTNAATGLTQDQVNAALFNNTANLVNNNQPQSYTPNAEANSNVQQPQYIPVDNTPDYAAPIANQYVQNNNDFAGWYEQESQRQKTENEQAQTTLYGFVDKQIQRLNGAEKKNSEKNGFTLTSYAPPANSTNGQYSGNGQNTDYGNSAVLMNNNNGQYSGNGQNTANGQGEILVAAGTRLTARLLNEVNTDEGDQVFAQITSGKFKGRKVIGNVRKTQDNIQFNFRRVLSDGKNLEFAMDGVGQTLQGSFGMATKIDRHIIKNSTAMIASSAAKGYGKAYENSIGSTTYTNNSTIVNQEDPSNKRIAGNIVGQLGNDFGQKIETIYGNKPTTYRTPVGTVFYIFINQDIRQ
ncbi:DotG/IcmE/VirB10 family protein [Acinetobacter sp. Marseille-Q1618]|uniref:DotG/IcmE/VirB10 family protein n=1 Tax=Acinetobacter sp. Marseille-Q1618 TaxID=2697502 RepID=UPI00156E6CA8|nr:DotG/IcmE/VirB10 family protein [Acinetobacter sp. Marseille-Q1618]